MLDRIRQLVSNSISKMFEEEDSDVKAHRIESARISSTRLKALERIRENKVVAVVDPEEITAEPNATSNW